MSDTAATSRRDLKGLLEPAFLICVALLLAGAGGLAVLGRGQVKKEPLPLRKVLTELDEKAIAPFRVMDRRKIAYEDVVKALGTEEYIQWTLEDVTVEPSSPLRYVSLFVTYYTGATLDKVVHTPEACYLGGGNQAGEAYNLDLMVKNWSSVDANAPKVSIPVRCATFTRGNLQAWETAQPFTVMYTFKVNGTYRRDRTATRRELGGLGRYAYYSKVEWQFFGISNTDRSMIYPSKEDAERASSRFLGIVLGELEKSHWPDWENAGK
jgi:hypothetical protein